MLCSTRPNGSVCRSCARRARNLADTDHVPTREMHRLLEENGHSKECVKNGRRVLDKSPQQVLVST